MKKITITLLIALAAGLMSAFVPVSLINPIRTDMVQSDLINNNEIQDLLFMREEEKMAHDLYAAFFDLYGLQAFQNIAASELTHADALIAQLAINGIADPAIRNELGVFIDPTLQDLYNQLFEQGSQSLADALKVAAAVEEIDILDLQTRAAQTSNIEIIQVYENLEAGSRNHLRAFVSQLKNWTGETYSAGYLPVDEFNAILAESNGNMNRVSRGGNGQGGFRGR